MTFHVVIKKITTPHIKNSSQNPNGALQMCYTTFHDVIIICCNSGQRIWGNEYTKFAPATIAPTINVTATPTITLILILNLILTIYPEPKTESLYNTLLEKNVQLGTLFVPYLDPSGKRVPKGFFIKPKQAPYITKNGSKEPKKVLKMVLKTHLEPFREHLKVPPVGQPKNPCF